MRMCARGLTNKGDRSGSIFGVFKSALGAFDKAVRIPMVAALAFGFQAAEGARISGFIFAHNSQGVIVNNFSSLKSLIIISFCAKWGKLIRRLVIRGFLIWRGDNVGTSSD